MQTQKYVAELIGTFLLVFLGTSAIVGFGGAFAAGAPTIGYLGIALTFGLTLTVLAYTLGPISGGHFNPAVTIGLVAARRFNAKDAGPYIVVQIIGAILASAVVLVVFAGNPALTATLAGATTYAVPAAGASAIAIGPIVMELLLTFVLVWTILAVSERNFSTPAFAGLAIGLALLVIHLAGIGISGASVNPARSIGPALIGGGVALQQLWVYIVAPIVGGIVAAGAYTALGMASATPQTQDTTTRA